MQTMQTEAGGSGPDDLGVGCLVYCHVASHMRFEECWPPFSPDKDDWAKDGWFGAARTTVLLLDSLAFHCPGSNSADE